MIPFPFNENRFHLLVGQLCTNPKSDRSLLSCLQVTQCSTSEIRDVPLYNSCSLPIQVMTTGPLPAPSKWKSGLRRITGTCPGWFISYIFIDASGNGSSVMFLLGSWGVSGLATSDPLTQMTQLALMLLQPPSRQLTYASTQGKKNDHRNGCRYNFATANQS